MNIVTYNTKTEFFRFESFYNKLKNHITHFQLRNLVVCGDNLANGVFYPSSYYHDNNLELVTLETHGQIDEYPSFFKINRLMPDNETLSTRGMKLDCLIDSRSLPYNSSSRISSSACSNKFLVNGTFEGGYLLQDISDPDYTRLVGEYSLTSSADGITNHIVISKDDSELIVASNDRNLRFIDIESGSRNTISLPFAVNFLALNPKNPHEYLITGDDVNSYVMDKRISEFRPQLQLSGHKDYGFGCDWSPADENLLLSGNQDGTVRLWDRRRPDHNLYGWSSSLGSHGFDIDSQLSGGPVRNCKFSYYGKHIVWAESLDHMGIIQVDDLKSNSDHIHSRVQSIDFIGKCIGLNTCPVDTGHGEQLLVGVNDCPLGGILNYHLEATDKPLDFDFTF